MRTLNLFETNAVAGGGYVAPPMAPAAPVVSNPVNVSNNINLMPDLLNITGILVGGYLGSQAVNGLPLISYSIKSFDVGHWAGVGIGSSVGAALGYAASKIFGKYVLSSINSQLGF